MPAILHGLVSSELRRLTPAVDSHFDAFRFHRRFGYWLQMSLERGKLTSKDPCSLCGSRLAFEVC